MKKNQSKQMEEMKILVMTSFGPVPFEAVKEHLPKEAVEFIEGMAELKMAEAPNVDLGYYIEKIADRKGWTPQKVNGWLGSIENESPIAAFNIVAREIAIDLDKKYEDHIENSEKIYVISPLDGRIHEVCKAHIKNYRNFAAFRTIEDARFACTLLREKLKGMFKTNAKRQ